MSDQPRHVRRLLEPQIVLEGAGVKLKRSIATATLDNLDPFLLFDHFGSKKPVESPRLVEFGNGDHVVARAADQYVRFLLVSGKPLKEPIARYGPFVMNTQQEIQQALADLRNGTFVKS